MDKKSLSLNSKEPNEEFLRKIENILKEEFEKEEKANAIIVPYVLNKMFIAYRILKFHENDNNKIEIHFLEPGKTMGYISITGKEINFEDPEELADLIRISSNVEILPLSNDSVEIDFTFHGLTILMED